VKVLFAVNQKKKKAKFILSIKIFIFSFIRHGFTQIFGMLVTGRMKLGHDTMQVPIQGQFPVVQVDCTRLLRNRFD
jgi:hypothetical protein